MKKRTLSQLEADCWKVFSVYIRLRDSNEYGMITCYTCPSYKEWKYSDAGHWRSRQFKNTLFHERNVHAQCKQCNGPYKGRPEEYRRNIIRDYGEGEDERLFAMSKHPKRFTREELEEMIIHYKNEVKKLKKEKGIA